MRVAAEQIMRLTNDGRWECVITLSVGDRDVHVVGLGETQSEAQQEAALGFSQAIDNLDRIAKVWKEHGRLDWSALGGKS